MDNNISEYSTRINSYYNRRDINLDIVKGIGIIAVIVGHLSPYGVKFIFSFHMPLFFVIAGFLYKQTSLKQSIHKDFKRLIIPYIITGLLIYLLDLLASAIWPHDTMHWLIGTLWGNGSGAHTSALFADIPYIGAIWFLLALFVCKQTFLILQIYSDNLIKLGLLSLTVSIIASLIDTIYINLPFAILPGLSAVIFYYAGYAIRRMGMFDRINLWSAIILVAIWVAANYFPEHHLSVVRCYYPIYPLTVLGGISATILIYCAISNLRKLPINHMDWIRNIFVWLGEVSLLIMCFHLIELNLPYLGSLLGFNTIFERIIFNFTFCIIGVVLLSQFPLARNLFKIRQVNIFKLKKGFICN
ncbi:MAG: acyltransferase family protein [Muribaculaceae bacterium]|nr:acyltransferase family protein [Muribaculaceae bacterium]